MLPTFMKTGRSQILFYVGVALVVIALYGVWKYGMNGPRVLGSEPLAPLGVPDQNQFSTSPPQPSEWQKMSVTVEGNTGALLTTLATALFGAMGWIMIEARKTPKKRHMWAGYLAALCTGVSLFFGAASQGHLVSMLSRGSFNPFDPMYRILNISQFGFLIAGACFLAGFAFYDLGKEH